MDIPEGTTVFKTVALKSQLHQKQEVTTPPKQRLQTSLQKNPENNQRSADSLPEDLAEIVSVWPELAEHIKAAIIGALSCYNPTERTRMACKRRSCYLKRIYKHAQLKKAYTLQSRPPHIRRYPLTKFSIIFFTQT